MALRGPGIVSLGSRQPGLTIFKSASAAFTPSSVTGLQAWYKADAGTSTTTDGVAVSQWNDQSGNARHLTQATGSKQPLYKAAIQNSKPVVRCDGVDDWMQHQAGASFVTGTSMTVFIVGIRRGNKANQGSIILRGTADTDDFNSITSALVGYEGAGNTIQQLFHFQGDASIASIPALGTAFCLTARWDGVNSNLRRDSTDAVAVADAYGAFGISTILVGSRWVSGAASPVSQHDYCEILVYNTNVSSTDRTSIQSYLKTRWGTP